MGLLDSTLKLCRDSNSGGQMNSQLRYEEEFIHYMGHIYCARPSGLPLTPKVISDTTGRLHRIEFVLGVKINEYVKTNEKFIELCELIKSKDKNLRSSPTGNKYGYSRYIYPVRLYYKFFCWKFDREIPKSNDSRLNQ